MYITFSKFLGYPKTLKQKAETISRFCLLKHCPSEYASYAIPFLLLDNFFRVTKANIQKPLNQSLVYKKPEVLLRVLVLESKFLKEIGCDFNIINRGVATLAFDG